MSNFSIVLEYRLPVSKEYHSLELIKAEEGYKEYLKYIVPLDSNLSSEAGDIQLQLSFISVALDANGNGVQRVRQTQPTTLHITPIAAWGDIIPDSSLAAIDQRIIKTQAQIKELEQLANALDGNVNVVDNLVYNDVDSTLQLSANGVGVGDKVSVKDMLDEGAPVVDFGYVQENKPSNKDETTVDNVVEF
jgi:hypothetical protein